MSYLKNIFKLAKYVSYDNKTKRASDLVKMLGKAPIFSFLKSAVTGNTLRFKIQHNSGMRSFVGRTNVACIAI